MPKKYKFPGGQIRGAAQMHLTHKQRREYQASRVLQSVVRMSLANHSIAEGPDGVGAPDVGPPQQILTPVSQNPYYLESESEDEEDLVLTTTDEEDDPFELEEEAFAEEDPIVQEQGILDLAMGAPAGDLEPEPEPEEEEEEEFPEFPALTGEPIEMPDRPNTPWEEGDHAGAEAGGFHVHYVPPSVFEGVVPRESTHPFSMPDEKKKKWQKTHEKDEKGKPIKGAVSRYYRPISHMEFKRREKYGDSPYEMTSKSTDMGPKHYEWIPKGEKPPKEVKDPFVYPETSTPTPLAQDWLDSQADLEGVDSLSKKGLPEGWEGTVLEWMRIRHADKMKKFKLKIPKAFLKKSAEQQRWESSLEHFIEEEWQHYGHSDMWRKKYGYRSDSGKIGFADPKTGVIGGWTSEEEEDDDDAFAPDPFTTDEEEEEEEEGEEKAKTPAEWIKPGLPMPSEEEIAQLKEDADEGDDEAFERLAELGLL
jgi:hypothetical protein